MLKRKLLLFFCMSYLAVANTPISFTPDEINYMKHKKEISVCFSPKGLPIFGYRNDKYIGILAELMQSIENEIPLKYRYVPVSSWQECIALSKQKKVDVIGLIVTQPNRHLHLAPTDKLIDGFIGIATKENVTLFNELHQLDGKKITFLKGQESVKQYVMKMFSNIKPVMVGSIKEGLDLVVKGEAYGYADETYSLSYAIRNHYNGILKIIDRINRVPISGSLGVQRENVLLLGILNKAIKGIDKVKRDDIIHKWIAVQVETKFDYKLFLQISLLFISIMLVSMYWIRKLSKEVKKREEAETNLKILNENLESEIEHQVKELTIKDMMLQEKTKLEAMGEMLGSIAHQWRRPLSALHINIELLETEYDDNNINTEFLKLFIERNSAIIQYMSQTIDDFQNFYKVDKVQYVYDVLEKVTSVIHLHLDYLSTENIKLSIEGESVGTYGCPNELQQVILNIINNAYDAHKLNHTIEPFIQVKVFAKEEHIYIDIIDNAGGIKEDVIDKVFEANFSTKDSIRNVGLGLYISKMVIENNMEGKLSVSNHLDGCCVQIVLKKEENE